MMWLRCYIFFFFFFCWALVLPNEKSDTPKTALEWPEECQKGPTYWCQNLRSASDCGSLNHCIQTVWMHQTLPKEDTSPVCKTCEDYISAVKNALSQNVTIKQMEIVLDGLCHLIPQYIIGKECAFAVNHLLPDVQSYFKTVDPHTCCSTVFLCSAAKTSSDYFKAKKIQITSESETPALTSDDSASVINDDSKAVAQPEKKPHKEIACRDCYTLVTTGKKIFSRASRDDVLKKMIELCGMLSSFSDACSAHVISYFSLFYNHLDVLKADEVCHLGGVCDELYHFHELTPDLKSAVDNAPNDTNDEVCEFCVAFFDHIRDALTANTTVDEFKKVLEGICKQTGSFADQCLELAENYYSNIYQFIVSELDGKQFCKVIKLCEPKKGAAIDELVPLWPVVPSVVDLDAALKNETSQHKVELNKALKDLNPPVAHLHFVGSNKCTWGPGYWCQNMTTSKQCSGTIKHCVGVWEKLELPADNGDICNVCKDMVKQARDQLNSNETQEELREVFEGSCKLLPTKVIKEECIKIVDSFIPELVEALSSQMNPQVVCATVGLCNSAKMDLLLQQEKMKMSEDVLLPIQPLPVDRMFPQFLTNLPQKTEIEKRGREACEMCELFLHYVQQQITLPKSEEEIKKVVNNVCVKLPKGVATQCSSFIEVYGDAFIALLAQEIDPSVVCPSIGACPSFLGFIDKVKPTCPLCLLAMEAIENKVLNNKTVENIEKAFEGLCRDLPKNMQQECDNFVKKSGDQLTDSILADFSPQETCQYLKFCPASHNGDVETFPVPSKSVEVSKTDDVKPDIDTNEVVTNADNRCVLCEFVMSKIDQELKDKKTAEDIKHTVHTICAHMPKSVKKQCGDFVDQYADFVIDLLAASLEPEQVCAALHLCKHDPPQDVLIKSMVSKCVVCEAMIGSLQGLSSDTRVEEAFETKLLRACDNLPEKYQDVCSSLVMQLAPQIEAIYRAVPSSFICYHLHICPRQMQRVEIISPKDCSNGPSFWCKSTTNAASCGEKAIQFCQQNIWKGSKPLKTVSIQEN